MAAIDRHGGLLYKVAAVYTNNTEDRNDLVQEIIYQLWKSFDSFNHQSSISTWMYRVAMNVAIYHLKTTRRRVSTVSLDWHELDFNAHNTDDTEEKWRMIRQSMDTLNLLDKGIVLLYLEDKSYEEIAQITGISVTNVGTRLSRIKDKLRQQIFKKV